MYSIKEIFLTLQGEGFHAGRAAVFCRFTGCNLWSGQENDRTKAICSFCDTDFVGMDGQHGGRYDVESLSSTINSLWLGSPIHKMVVLTGGEPLLQVDGQLVEALHQHGFYVAIETNGSLPLPIAQSPTQLIDWVCVSPKAHANWVLKQGNELKVVFPQNIDFQALETAQFDHYFLQPMAGSDGPKNTALAVDFCLKNPKWQLSLQTHKIIGID